MLFYSVLGTSTCSSLPLTCTTSHFLDWVDSSNGETLAQFRITSIPGTEFKPLPSLHFIAFNLMDVSESMITSTATFMNVPADFNLPWNV